MSQDYTCTQCGRPIEDTDPDFRSERAETGRERVFRTIPELCPTCRGKRLWKRVKRIKEGERD